MSVNIDVLVETAIEQGVAAAKGHGEDLRGYLEKRAAIVSQGLAQLAKDRLEGHITNEDVQFAWKEIRASERTARLAVQLTTRAALQDAVNAALAVAAGAVNQAIGIKVL